MRWLLRINNALLGRLICGPWLSVAGFFAREGGAILPVPMCGVHGRIMSPDAFRFSCCSGRWVFRYGSISLVCWPALSLIAFGPLPNIAGMKRKMAAASLSKRAPVRLFLNNNLHLVHHAHPQVLDICRVSMHARRWRKRSAGYVPAIVWRTMGNTAERAGGASGLASAIRIDRIPHQPGCGHSADDGPMNAK